MTPSRAHDLAGELTHEVLVRVAVGLRHGASLDSVEGPAREFVESVLAAPDPLSVHRRWGRRFLARVGARA